MRLHNGPLPTPTAIMEARGSRRAIARRAEEEGHPRAPMVTIPTKDETELDPVASAKWDEMVEHLAALGVLSFVDKHILTRYCVLYSQWAKCQEILRTREGPTFQVFKDGQVIDVRVYPEVNIAAHLFDHLLKIEDRFGLSPASRASLRTKAVMNSVREVPVKDKSRFFND